MGSHVVKQMRERGSAHVFVPRSAEYNLTKEEAIIRLFKGTKPDVIIYLAAVVGGIGANRENP